MGCSNDSKHYTLLHKTFANAKGHLALPGQYLHAAAPPASTTSSSRNTPNCTTTETISICPYLSPARVEGGRERERERGRPPFLRHRSQSRSLRERETPPPLPGRLADSTEGELCRCTPPRLAAMSAVLDVLWEDRDVRFDISPQ